MRGLSATFIVTSLLALIVVAYPIPRRYGSDNNSLKLLEGSSTSLSLVHHQHRVLAIDSLDIDSLVRRSDRALSPEERSQRRGGRADRKKAKKTAKHERFEAAKAKGKFIKEKRFASSKVTFGKAAKAKLDELGLHGKERKKAKKYHASIMKAEMSAHGAHTGRVFHLAHEGGIDPKEKKHITAGLYRKEGTQIHSPWAERKKQEKPGLHTKGLFHLYTENHPKLREPSAFAAAEKALKDRKIAEAEAERLKAETQKTQHVEAQRAAGARLSEDDKRALRKARKEAKKGQ